MEYECEHCGGLYLPKRTDSRYCSHTCRQLAYVLRKAQPSLGSEANPECNTSGLFANEAVDSKNLSVRTDQEIPINTHLSVNGKQKEPSSDELSVKTDSRQLPVNGEMSVNEETKKEVISVNQNKKDPPSEELSVNKEIAVNAKSKMNSEYKEYPSRFLEELNRLQSARNSDYHLYSLFAERNKAAIWVSERYRCLLECSLTFSEMIEVETNDLKEVCNAFTDVIFSRYFTALSPKYPYLDEIRKMRERIKKICIEAEESNLVKLRLSREEKQNLMVSRFDLSHFILKKSFSELNFKE